MRSKICVLVLVSIFCVSCTKNSSQKEEENQPEKIAELIAIPKPFEIIKGDGNWPSFRGEKAFGVADELNLPGEWDGSSGKNIKWKTDILGLAHSSPIVWEEKLFVTSAISSIDSATYKHGLYGAGDASEDKSLHKWMVYCLDKNSGEILWEQLAHEGIPKDKRHIKSTYANSTPVTNGHYVLALFGSEGLFCYTMDGKFVWRKDLGRMNVGAYNGPHLEWGPASSPIIFKEKVIIQTDTSKDDYIIAVDIHTGETIWKTERDELPGWGTPTVVESDQGAELVTNSSNFIYGYNPDTGEEMWRLGGSSQITSPTPIYQDSLIFVCSGRGPEAPIFAIKIGARGNITLIKKQTSNEFVAWSKTKAGPYMPTPLIYRGYFYTLNNNGQFRCYGLETGIKIYSDKVPHKGGGFSGSPVASDGKIFCPAEDGNIIVIKSGLEFEVIADNDLGDRIMSTPALSEGKMFVRTEHFVYAIGN